MKRISIALLSLLFFSNGFGQVLNNPENISEEATQKCAQYEVTEWMKESNPARYQNYLQSREILAQEAASPQLKNGTIYTVPVVFHVLHNNGAENISDAQLQDALFILNRDFRKQNADVNNVVSQFFPLATDVEVEFEFATIAPDGTCFEGITRTQTTQTSNSSQSGGEAQVNAVISGNDVYQGVWPHNKYLNIYICKSLIQGAAGYTFLPNGGSQANATNMYYNGIFMLHNYTGSIGTGNVSVSRALTHEVGHWLNLSHIWGDGQIGTCGTDYVADTPQTTGAQSCNLSKATCDGTLDNVENYMDYAYCSKMFTQGQVTRMRSAITSTVGGRNNIWKQANLQDVGVVPGGSSACANIEATNLALCEGSSTTYSIDLGGEVVYSYSWSFPGGTPATSTAATPTVTYNSSGVYDVTVTVNTSSGTNTYTKENLIEVITAPAAVSLPMTEGFVATTFPPAGWTIDNGGNSTTWTRATVGTAPTTGNSARLNFDPGANTTGNIDDLNTPSFSLINAESASLTFDVAYREWNSFYSDQLQVLVSTGCGQPFEIVYDKAGSTLATQSSGSGYTNPTTWRNETIDLSSYAGNDALIVKFRGISGYGNAVYLDNVNITQVEIDNGTAPEPGMSVNNNQICAGQTVSFTDESTENPTSWNWTFPGGTPNTSTSQNPTITYNSPGTYNVVLEASNNTGSQSTTFTNEITVYGAPSVTATASTTTICAGSSVTLTAAGAGSYSWSNGLGNGASQTVSPTATTTYTVTGTANGCVNTATVTVTVLQAPSISISASDMEICVGESVTLTATGASSYSWNNGLGSGNSKTVSPASTTTYEVTSSNGTCSTTESVTVVVNAIPNVSASVSDIEICQGLSTLLTGSGADSYSWNNGLGNGASQTVSPTSTTTYEVTGTTNGCTASATVTVNVISSPNVTISATSTEICLGGSVTLTGSGATSFEWNNGLGNGSTQVVTPTETTTYSVLGSNGGECDGSASITIKVEDIPSVSITASNTTICDGESVELIADGANSYAWSPGATLSTTSGQTVTATPSATTTYTLTGVNNCGSDSETITVTVNASPNTPVISQNGNVLSVTLQNGEMATWYFEGTEIGAGASITFTETGNYEVVVTNTADCSSSATGKYSTTTGVQEEEVNSLKLFPNPTTGQITLTSTLVMEHIVVLDNQGRVVANVNANNTKEVKLNLHHLAAGSYHIQTKMGEEIKVNKLIIK